jgi:hypothetical protein
MTSGGFESDGDGPTPADESQDGGKEDASYDAVMQQCPLAFA